MSSTKSHDKAALSGGAQVANAGFPVGKSERNSRRQQLHQLQKQAQQQSAQRLAVSGFYRRVRDAIQGEKAAVDELLKWAAGNYAALLSGLDGGRQRTEVKDPARVGEAKLEKYKSRGLTYSVRHISPAIVRRQRADRTQSKDLSVLIEELEHHDRLWTAYVQGFKDSLGSGLSVEQKDASARVHDEKLYEIYKSLWVIVEKLNATGGTGP